MNVNFFKIVYYTFYILMMEGEYTCNIIILLLLCPSETFILQGDFFFFPLATECVCLSVVIFGTIVEIRKYTMLKILRFMRREWLQQYCTITYLISNERGTSVGRRDIVWSTYNETKFRSIMNDNNIVWITVKTLGRKYSKNFKHFYDAVV